MLSEAPLQAAPSARFSPPGALIQHRAGASSGPEAELDRDQVKADLLVPVTGGGSRPPGEKADGLHAALEKLK